MSQCHCHAASMKPIPLLPFDRTDILRNKIIAVFHSCVFESRAPSSKSSCPLLLSHLYPYYYLCLLRSHWSWLKCTCWPLRLTLFFPLPNLCLPPRPLSTSLSPATSPSFFLRLSFLAVSCGAEANEGWLRLLWLLQGHRLHRWLQRRLRTAVSPAARAPRRWPQFQQRAHVLRVRITSNNLAQKKKKL